MRGLHKNISNEEYHASSPYSSSQFKKALKSIASMNVQTFTTKAMERGTAAHTLILEGEKFDSEYAVSPTFDKRTKIGKADFAAFSELHKGKTIINQDEERVLLSMLDSVNSHKFACELIDSGEPEISVFFEDHSVECKVRPDVLADEYIVDLKTTQSADPEDFARSAVNFGYHLSAAMYMRGVELATGTRRQDFFFVVVENQEPFLTEVYRLPSEAISQGEKMYLEALLKVRDYLKGAKGVSYTNQNVTDLVLPAWAFK